MGRIYASVIKNQRSVYNIHETSLLRIFCLLITEEENFYLFTRSDLPYLI